MAIDNTNIQVTIFGGSGFLGRYIVKRLAKLNMRVRVAVRHPNQAHFLKPLGNVGQICPIPADIKNEKSVLAAIEGSDIVINCVGILYEGGGQSFDNIVYHGAENIAKACKQLNVQKFVHISAIGANENSDSSYAKTKGLAEKNISNYMPRATILRPSVIFGIEDNFFNMFAKIASISPFLPLIGGGHTKMQPVYVGDVADAVIKVIQNNACEGKIYELGGNEILTFKEILEKICFYIGKKRTFIPIPFLIASIKAFFLEFLPKPLLTRDQVKLLQHDNIVSSDALSFKDLGINPTEIDDIVPDYLKRFRESGDYDQSTGFDHSSQRDV
jgi:NADH dehydrogenase